MTDWQPTQYLTFADERTRAARDLLEQVPLRDAHRVYDLGCGPGNSTALLTARFPHAQVIGIDNSPAMLDAARKACPQAGFEAGDLAQWMPDATPDLLFANAAFQWVPDHLAVIDRLSRSLPEGGVLAVQMPDNLNEPSHALMSQVAEEGGWTGSIASAKAARDLLPTPAEYYARLKPIFRHLDIWHTIYNHPLRGVSGIVAWLSTTGLRPYLDPLGEDDRKRFIARYQERLAQHYPVQQDGMVLLRFPRLFIVGVR